MKSSLFKFIAIPLVFLCSGLIPMHAIRLEGNHLSLTIRELFDPATLGQVLSAAGCNATSIERLSIEVNEVNFPDLNDSDIINAIAQSLQAIMSYLAPDFNLTIQSHLNNYAYNDSNIAQQYITKIMHHMPKTFSSFKLRVNFSVVLDEGHLELIMSELPEGLKALDFSNGTLRSMFEDCWDTLLTNLPAKLGTLNLSGNSLQDTLPPEYLQQIKVLIKEGRIQRCICPEIPELKTAGTVNPHHPTPLSLDTSSIQIPPLPGIPDFDGNPSTSPSSDESSDESNGGFSYSSSTPSTSNATDSENDDDDPYKR